MSKSSQFAKSCKQISNHNRICSEASHYAITYQIKVSAITILNNEENITF